MIGSTLDAHVSSRRLASMSTARQGLAVDVSYRTTLADDRAADGLVRALNRVEGVQSVTLERAEQNEVQT